MNGVNRAFKAIIFLNLKAKQNNNNKQNNKSVIMIIIHCKLVDCVPALG